MRPILLLLMLNLHLISFAQADDLEQWGLELRMEDHAYYPGIQTVFLYKLGDPRSFPAIRLGSGERLQLEFDDLLAQGTTFNYTVIHCNADWSKSDLNPSEYLYGYQNYYLTDFDFSFNTFMPYTHYRLTFPNEEMRFTKSGNYLLVIYEDDPNHPLLTRRFVVYEDFVRAGGEVRRPNRVEYRDTHQEVDFFLSHGGYDIPDPFNNFQISLLQNQQWNSALNHLQPRFLQNGRMDYNYDFENLFPGQNEWRNFDTKDERNLSMNVRRIELDTLFTYFLQTDLARSISRYSTEFDINGQRVIRVTGKEQPSIEADYVWVDFELAAEQADNKANYYVFGALSDWKILPRFRMRYDYNKGVYRARILLKQGYYNYMYVSVDDASSSPNFEPIEGAHWETENDYQLIMYHREIGIRYDRVVGFAVFSSQDLY